MTNDKAWEFAVGIVQLDGIKPSDELMELIEKGARFRYSFGGLY